MMSAVVPTITANGIELYYERRGGGPRLLFFNGSGASLATSARLGQPPEAAPSVYPASWGSLALSAALKAF